MVSTTGLGPDSIAMQRGWRKYYRDLLNKEPDMTDVRKTNTETVVADQQAPPANFSTPVSRETSNQNKWPSTGAAVPTGSPQNLGLVEDGSKQTTPKG